MDSISSQMDAMIRQALTGAAIDFAEAAQDEDWLLITERIEE